MAQMLRSTPTLRDECDSGNYGAADTCTVQQRKFSKLCTKFEWKRVKTHNEAQLLIPEYKTLKGFVACTVIDIWFHMYCTCSVT